MPKSANTKVAGQYVWRSAKTGKFVSLKIAKPQKRPTSVSGAKIKRAIREAYAVGKN